VEVPHVRADEAATAVRSAELPEDIRAGMLAHGKRIEEQCGRRELQKMIGRGHDKAWDYGYANGKLAALRWVLGDEWDFLDT
jgi:hypothetical protein